MTSNSTKKKKVTGNWKKDINKFLSIIEKALDCSGAPLFDSVLSSPIVLELSGRSLWNEIFTRNSGEGLAVFPC